MEHFLQIIGMGIIGAILAVVLGKREKELNVLLVIACCVGVLLLSFTFLEPIVDFLVRLRILGGLQEEYVAILLKSAGMSLILELTCTICDDAGQASLGKTVRICGNAALMYIALPLLQAVVELLEKLLGG